MPGPILAAPVQTERRADLIRLDSRAIITDMFAVRVAAWTLCLVALAVPPAHAQLTVAAASDLQTVLPVIAERFQHTERVPVRISYGSSGQFVTQIQNKAPFDLFLSADDAYITALVMSGHADGSTVVPYATGRLALWTRADRGIDTRRGLAALTDARIHSLSIANPAHAPYGRAAVEALQRMGLYEQLRQRIVMGENVSQAAQFAQTGNADAAIIALSLTMAPAMRSVGAAVEIPVDAFSPIRQAGVVIRGTSRAEQARRLLAFLTTPDIATLLLNAGFGAPR